MHLYVFVVELMLPSMHLLRRSEACQPCGQPYNNWRTALKSRDVQHHAIANNVLNAGTDCVICGQILLKAAALGDGTKNIEVLVENKDCGHAFHRTCLAGWIDGNGRVCPLCRTPINLTVLRRLGKNKTIKENEAQRLGHDDNDPAMARFYGDEGERARATHGREGPRVDDDDHDSDPEDLIDLREELNELFDDDVDDDEDVLVLKNLREALDDDVGKLITPEYAPKFARWVSYVIRHVYSEQPLCSSNILKVLKLLKDEVAGGEWMAHVKQAVKYMMHERPPNFPSCTQPIIDYLRGIGEHTLAGWAENAVDTMKERRRHGERELPASD